MNRNLLKKYIDLATQKGINPIHISYSSVDETEVSVIAGKVAIQKTGTAHSISGRGIHEGKTGYFSTDRIDKKTADLMMEGILESSRFGKEGDNEDYYHGEKKYRKKKSVSVNEAGFSELKELALELYDYAKKKDDRVKEVDLGLSCSSTNTMFMNSYGKDSTYSTTGYYGAVTIIANDIDGEPRTFGYSFRSRKDIEEFREKGFKAIDKAVKYSVDFFKSGPCRTGEYKVLMNPESVGSLISFYLSHLSAKKVQEHLSLFEGKIGQRIASPKLTIDNTPYYDKFNVCHFDAEGTPVCSFPVIRKGVLLNYAHSLETARKAGCDPNGCGTGDGHAGFKAIVVKRGKDDLENLFKRVNNGIYIIDISGLNSGIDGQTLHFSLPFQGYLIKEGRIDKAISMNLMSGNLEDLMNNIIAVGNDGLELSSTDIPSILFKKVSISG